MCIRDSTYTLDTNGAYTLVVTRSGYVGQKLDVIAGEDSKNITVKLDKAPESTHNDILQPGDWPLFRADSNNNGVVSAPTPITAEDAVLVWANKVGEGYGASAASCPIIAGGYLYAYARDKLLKIDKDTGAVVGEGTMVTSSSFAINSPTYADGMIFVALSGGRIQAFDAESLESLWVYTDPLGGQPNCPIAYCDGYIYTGFWNSETKQANFAGISVTDEDPTQPQETKLAAWTYTHNGFYWAGAYACENFVLVTTDDGESGYTTGYGSVLSLDPKTGVLLDQLKATNVGDLRSSVCYDPATDAYYFTSKGGDLYQVRTNEDGTFVKGSLNRLHLDNGGNDDNTPPMSTSTPVIHNGRAYIGVSGTSQFGAYSGHNMTVVDLESFSIAYTVPTQGYPQTSGLLTTAYEDQDGYAYVYFFDNYTPGKLRVLRDKPGMTEVDHTYTTMETYNGDSGEVTIETEPKTLASGYYISTSLLIALGVQDKLVGVEAKADKRTLYSLSAPELQSLPSIGTAKEFDLEGCAALTPDLVIVPAKLKDSIPQMEELGLTVLAVKPEDQDKLYGAIDLLAQATNTVARGEELKSAIEDNLLSLREAIGDAEAPTVYMAGNSSVLQTAGPAMYQNYMIENAGGLNAAAGVEDTYWAEVSYEQVLDWDPDYIILASDADYDVDSVLNDAALADCTAVREGHVYQLPHAIEAVDSPVPGSFLGSVYLGSVLHPEQVSEQFYHDCADAFYTTYYGFTPASYE